MENSLCLKCIVDCKNRELFKSCAVQECQFFKDMGIGGIKSHHTDLAGVVHEATVKAVEKDGFLKCPDCDTVFDRPSEAFSHSCECHQKSEKEESKGFEGRFMPNVKFVLHRDDFIALKSNPSFYNDEISLNGLCWGKTDEKGEDFYVFKKKPLGFEKVVSKYEAIPELVPEGFYYDKEKDSILSKNEVVFNNDYLKAFNDSALSMFKDLNIAGEALNKTHSCSSHHFFDDSKVNEEGIIEKKGGDPTPDYYGEKCKCGRKIDWYTIGDLYRKDKGSAWEHAMKKLLRAGEGHKSLEQDIDETIDSLNRWKEQLNDKED